jgi:hypothetical protein
MTSGRLQVGLIAMSERDLQRIEILSKVMGAIDQNPELTVFRGLGTISAIK